VDFNIPKEKPRKTKIKTPQEDYNINFQQYK